MNNDTQTASERLASLRALSTDRRYQWAMTIVAEMHNRDWMCTVGVEADGYHLQEHGGLQASVTLIDIAYIGLSELLNDISVMWEKALFGPKKTQS